MPIPTPLYYNSACIFAQIPPRQNDFKRIERDADNSTNKSNNSSATYNENAPEKNGNIINASKAIHTENTSFNKERVNPVINVVGIACGYDYTVAIQPG